MQLQILKNHGIFVQIFCFCFFFVVFFFVGLIFWFIFLVFISSQNIWVSLSLKCSLGVLFEYTSQMVQDSIALISR